MLKLALTTPDSKTVMKIPNIWMTFLGLLHLAPSHAAEDLQSYRSRSAEGLTALLSSQPKPCSKSADSRSDCTNDPRYPRSDQSYVPPSENRDSDWPRSE